MLSAKPERRINWAAWRAGTRLLVSLIVVPITFFVLPKYADIRFNSGIPLYIGILLYVGGASITYFWAIRHVWSLRKINFTNPITTTRRLVTQIENFQMKEIKIGSFMVTPILAICVFLIFNMRGASISFLLFFCVTMIALMYLRFKKSSQWFKKLNAELDEIEQLEKE